MGETVTNIGMSQFGSMEEKALPQLPPLESPVFGQSNPFELASPAKTATTTRSVEDVDPSWASSPRTTRTVTTAQSRGSELPPWTPASSVAFTHTAVGMSIKPVRPPPPISKDLPRPGTSSTKRSSFSVLSKPRMLKYAAGKNGDIELVPQPSDDSEDPLNWPMWRKNLNFFVLLYMVALIGVSKTMFVTVNSNIALTNGVSYTAAVALTGVPLCVSALAGVLSVVVAKIFGKRPIYLVSTMLIFIGAMWGMYVMNSFSQNMASRVFQGFGWGAFDTLVLGSLQDTFFEHELGSRIIAVQTVSIAATWGAPLLGGVASAGPRGFCLQYEILSVFLALGTWLVAFGVPESTFDRSSISMFSRDSLLSRPRLNWPWIQFSKEAARDYVLRMKPWTYRVLTLNRALFLQIPCTMFVPTNLLLFTVSLLPFAALWGFVSSLSLLFSVMPFLLSTASMGLLLLGPFIFATPIAIVLALPLYTNRFTSTVHYTTLAVGGITASIGMLSFGLYVEGSMTTTSNGSITPLGTTWKLNDIGDNLSFPVISFLLGLLAAGSLALDATFRPMVQRSVSFTSANLSVSRRNSTDMHAGLTCLRNLVAGAFVLGLPNAVWAWDGLRSAAMGMGIAQFFVAGAVGCVWWQWQETVWRLDGKVVGFADPYSGAEKSFFDTS